MNGDMKLRLYLTAIVVTMGFLYASPFFVISHYEGIRSELLASCLKESSGYGFDFCWNKSQKDAELPFAEYLLPFLPAAALLWFNWFIKPDLTLTEEFYPRRTINGLLWLGLLVAAVAVWIPLYDVTSRNSAELHKISSITFWRAPWIASAWLIPPLLFQHLVGPTSLSARMRIGKIAIWILTATPIAALAIYVAREAIRNSGG